MESTDERGDVGVIDGDGLLLLLPDSLDDEGGGDGDLDELASELLFLSLALLFSLLFELLLLLLLLFRGGKVAACCMDNGRRCCLEELFVAA